VQPGTAQRAIGALGQIPAWPCLLVIAENHDGRRACYVDPPTLSPKVHISMLYPTFRQHLAAVIRQT
jgi:hypothetical protein